MDPKDLVRRSTRKVFCGFEKMPADKNGAGLMLIAVLRKNEVFNG